MKRRTLVGGIAAAAAAAAAPGTASPRRIGMSDVNRLNKRFAEIIASDHRHGGQPGIEEQATALADEALNLQNAGTATQRVRSSLYASGAAFRSSAMWAAIDGRRYDVAKAHMREAQTLAEMSGDQAIKFRIWSHAGTMYRHMGRPADACAANDVARNLHLTRRDPLFACLGHARQAATLSLTGDTAAVQHALGCAQDALERADPDLARPVWMAAVRDGAELETLALSAHLRLGNFAQAESHAHRSLTLLCPQMQRDRAINTARLAHAQLGQGDADAATATAMKVPANAATCHARVSRMLQEFCRAPRHRTVQYRRPDLDRAHHHMEEVRMTLARATELRTFTVLDAVRGDLLDVYANVRVPLLHLPNYAVTAFGERLDRHAAEPGFTAVLAYADGGHPVGFAYGNTVEHGDRYWQRISPSPAERYTERPAVALKEGGVRPAWRKTGTARRIHDALLAARDEKYVTLMVNPMAGDGKVHTLYKSWGYVDIGRSQPSPASPVLTVMIRASR